MRLLVTGLALVTLTGSVLAATTTLREVQTGNVAVGAALPIDLTSPEGKTRWHLESIAPGASALVAISNQDQGFVQETRRTGQAAPARVAISGADAERWLLPDHDPSQMKMGARVFLQFNETRDGLVDRLTAEVATVGIGWLLLPDDPQEVVLQRVLVSRQRAGERAMIPEALIHRWVSPREGVLATISGPASADGRTRLAVDSITIVEKVLTGAATMKLYADQLYRGEFTDLKYGYDKGVGTLVSSLVPAGSGVNNMCDLANLSTWDFSGVTTGSQTATTKTPSSAAETCNAARCGYAGYPPDGSLQTPILERFDRNLTATLRKDNQVVQRENRVTDVTFWLRAATQNENAAGALGTGESRICFADESGKPRNEVPVWQLAHNDASGWYTQAGDTWASVPVDSPACQETFYTLRCGVAQPLTPNPLWGRSCTNSGQTYGGKQSGKIVQGGVVKLPSGHTLNALLLRNTTEFCVYTDSACALLTDKVRTIVYIWQAPFVGAVALLQSAKKVDFATGETGETPCTAFTTVAYTDISYGLLPPVSITAGAVTDTTLSLSWNPGNDTHRLAGYKIYWDTDPGASTNYAFDSVTNPGQVAFAGTTATISGLTPGATYYVTVTSLSDFTDPSTGVVTRYESIRYPTTVSGDPNFSYPIEVATTTTGGTCIPTLQVTGLTVDKSAPNIHACWSPTTDACAVGYDVLASDDATSDINWSVVGQVGLTTCWDGNPSQKFLLIRSRGTGGNGPWGHYLR